METEQKEQSETEQKYYYIFVKFGDYDSEKLYNYISDDTTIKRGDIVYVDANDNILEAIVVDTGFFTSEDAPYPVYLTKHIISKKIDDMEYEYIDRLEGVVFSDELHGAYLENGKLEDNYWFAVFDDGRIVYDRYKALEKKPFFREEGQISADKLAEIKAIMVEKAVVLLQILRPLNSSQKTTTEVEVLNFMGKQIVVHNPSKIDVASDEILDMVLSLKNKIATVLIID